MSAAPPVWRAGGGEIEVVFVGRAPATERAETLRRVAGGERPVAWLEQRHTAICRRARPGSCGEGDALWSDEPGLALCVATADCVPVALAGGRGLALAHAGWRGIVAGVVAAAAGAVAPDGGRAAAWIGPAIGPCCYEVGPEVARRVAAASAAAVAAPGPGGRPHLDLAAAVEWQLRAAGICAIERHGPCTRCSPARLWSYRRDGAGAGRNLAFAWLRHPPPPAREGRRGSG